MKYDSLRIIEIHGDDSRNIDHHKILIGVIKITQ